MKGVVVYWRIVDYGGGERLAKYTADALNTEVYTINWVKRKNVYGFKDIYPKIPASIRILFKLPVRIPFADYLAWSSIDLGDYDYIITLGARARSIITREETVHIHYILSVERWLYDLHYRTVKQRKGILNKFLMPYVEELTRLIDSAVDKRVDYYISISEVIKRRLWKYLKRESEVLYPPIFFKDYRFRDHEDFYLFIARLYPEKRVMETVKAFAKLGKELVVCGEGQEAEKVRYYAKKYPNIKYLGYVDRETKIDLLSRCRAVVCPYVGEDFGIVPIEALASGKPIIVARDGGFPKLLVERYKCGVITTATVKGIIDSVKRLEIMLKQDLFDEKQLRDIARKFDYYEYFKPRLNELVKKYVKLYHSMLDD